MAINDALYSSRSEEWGTPQQLFDALDAEFHFDLDAAANAGNAKCKRYLDVASDALSQTWDARAVWLNPPYGDTIGQWMAKARDTVLHSDALTCVCLVHARTDTAWWWDCVMNQESVNVELRFIKGRVKFKPDPNAPPPPKGKRNGSTFPSVLVIYRLLDEAPSTQQTVQVTPRKVHVISRGYRI